MMIFHSYVSLPEGNIKPLNQISSGFHRFLPLKSCTFCIALELGARTCGQLLSQCSQEVIKVTHLIHQFHSISRMCVWIFWLSSSFSYLQDSTDNFQKPSEKICPWMHRKFRCYMNPPFPKIRWVDFSVSISWWFSPFSPNFPHFPPLYWLIGYMIVLHLVTTPPSDPREIGTAVSVPTAL